MNNEDCKDLIKAEHRQTELQRLDSGQEGCGCADCQDFYRTIDLKKYGARVKNYGGVVYVGPKKAILVASPKNDPPMDILKAPKPLRNRKKGVTKIVVSGKLPTPTPKAFMLHMKKRRGRPPKAKDEPITRMTEWRRRKKAEQGILL